ncbi:phage head closure protein [Aliarcobacter cryaerophilus]|uniref:phage head closure protein n=1 Tax=Aliarcobacter cryaerophilus TaxID=28198 RepID=UPI003DA1F642
MRAGRLRQIIQIQRFIELVDDFGGIIQDWKTILTARAEIKPITAKEIFASNVVISEVTHKITIRYEVDILPKDRIIYNERVFDITGAINLDENNTVVEILAKEIN